MTELLRSVLLIVVAFVLRYAIVALGVPLDEGTFAALVAAIVALIVGDGASNAAARSALGRRLGLRAKE